MSRFLTALLVGTLCLVQASADSGRKRKDKQPAKSDKAQAELKWAKGVVLDFFNAAKHGQDDERKQATLLMTDKLKKALSSNSLTPESFISYAFQNNRIASWTIKVEEIAPDVNEAVFRGTFTGKDPGNGKEIQADFVVRVVKEHEGGKWRINIFTIGNWNSTEKELKK